MSKIVNLQIVISNFECLSHLDHFSLSNCSMADSDMLEHPE